MSGIFICYRRADAEGWAGRLSDSFKKELGRVNIFRDIEDIPPGVEFDSYINDAVGSCDVLIALIGPHWLTVKDKNGVRRIDDPKDFTRLEIVTALKRNVRVIPALVGGGQIPNIDELPDELKPLARRQSFELSDSRWVDDCRKLADVLRTIIKKESWLSTMAAKAIFVSLLVLVIFVFGGKLWLDSNIEKEDTLSLKSISPSLGSTLQGSSPIKFQMRLSYDLVSAKEAVLSMGALVYPQSAGGCSGKYEGANKIQMIRIAEGSSDVSFEIAYGTYPEGGYLNFSANFLDATEYYERGSKRAIKKFEEFKDYCFEILPDPKTIEEAALKAKEEAERKAKLEAEEKAKEEAALKAKLAAEQKTKEEAAQLAKLEADRKAEEEAQRKADVARRAKTLQKTSFSMPGDGTRNNNGYIGPFCCTGRTAVVYNGNKARVGYIYFKDFKGGFNFEDGTGGANSLGILVSGLAKLTDVKSVQQESSIWFSAKEMKRGMTRSTSAGGLHFKATILQATLGEHASRGAYYLMGSVKVKIDVSVLNK